MITDSIYGSTLQDTLPEFIILCMQCNRASLLSRVRVYVVFAVYMQNLGFMRCDYSQALKLRDHRNHLHLPGSM